MISEVMLSELALQIEQINQNYIFEAQTFFFLRPSPDCIYLDFNRKGRLYLFSRIKVGKEGDRCIIDKFDYDLNIFQNLKESFIDTLVEMIGEMMKQSLGELVKL